MNDTLIQERPKLESFRIETPLGAVESDSGNHTVDVVSVVCIIIVLYLIKKIYSWI